MRAGPVGLLVLSVAAALAPGRAPASETELERLRRAIEERRARVQERERDEQGLLGRLEQIDRRLEGLEAELARAEAGREAARRERHGLEERVAGLEAALARTRASLRVRAVALYRTGDFGPLAFLLSAEDLGDLLFRLAVLGRLLDRDRALLDRYRQEHAALEAAAAAAGEAEERLARAAREVAARTAALEGERARRVALLEEVRSSRAREESALAELERAARELERALDDLDRRPAERVTEGPPFESLRGQLEPPVDSPVVRRFGRVVDREFHTAVLRKGVEFGAPAGAPVRAVADGVVRFAGWFRGYGKLVILDHGDGYFTVSGHLDTVEVEAGERVGRGEVIGTVGDTGSLSGPGLHFEIRRGAEALDPEPWWAP